MVMNVSPRSSSAGMRSIRRELLQRRRPKPLTPTRSVAKKPAASPPPRHGSSDAVRRPCPRPPHREVLSSTISHCRCSTVTDASTLPRRSSSRCTPVSPPPPPLIRSDPSSTRSAFRATPSVPAQLLEAGTVVRVRTRTATLKTGQVLVLCLKATIVSSSTDGGYGVVYDANWPRGDPKSTVHVAPNQIKVIDPSPPLTIPASRLPPPTAAVAATSKKEMPRPTRQGRAYASSAASFQRWSSLPGLEDLS